MNENERSTRNKDELWADRGVSRGETSKCTQLSANVSGTAFNDGAADDIDWNTTRTILHLTIYLIFHTTVSNVFTCSIDKIKLF